MVKARFHKKYVRDGDEIELPDGVCALTILYTRVPGEAIVAWLEEVKE